MVRQAIFTVLALRSLLSDGSASMSQADDEDGDLACVLRSERARQIFSKSFGRPVPDGLLGALERLGGKLMKSATAYFGLLAIYENPANHQKAEALKYVGAITERILQITEIVDERWCHHELLKRLQSVEEARDFNQAVAYAQSVNSRVTDEVVRASISQLKQDVPVAKLVRRWVRRADRFPDQPVVVGAHFKPLASSRDLIEAGYRFRNCLGSKGLEQALIGAVAFLEFQHEGQGAILELRPLSDQSRWVLWEVHNYRNGLVPDHLEEAAQIAASAEGIPYVGDGSQTDQWRRYRKFTRMQRGPGG